MWSFVALKWSNLHKAEKLQRGHLSSKTKNRKVSQMPSGTVLQEKVPYWFTKTDCHSFNLGKMRKKPNKTGFRLEREKKTCVRVRGLLAIQEKLTGKTSLMQTFSQSSFLCLWYVLIFISKFIFEPEKGFYTFEAKNEVFFQYFQGPSIHQE